MARSVGVHWRKERVALATLGGSLRRPVLLDLVTRSRQDGDLAGPAGEMAPGRQPVHLALPSRLVTMRRITLPLTDLDQVQRTIRYQAEKYVPAITPEEVAVDFFINRREADCTVLTLLVVKRADLAGPLAALRDSGIEPRQVTVDLLALHNLLAHAGVYGQGSCTVVVDLAAGALHLLVVHQGRLVAVRKPAAAGPEELGARLAREIPYSLVAGDVEGRADRVVLVGPLPAPESVTDLARRLDCPVEIFDPLDSIPFKDEGELRNLAREAPAAIGAALAGLGRVDLPVDFLRRERRYKSGYERLRTPLLAGLALLVAWLALLLLVTMRDAGVVHRDKVKMETARRNLYRRVVQRGEGKGKRIKLPRRVDRALENLARRRSGDDAGGAEWRSFLDFLRNLTQHLPADDGRTIITRVIFKGDEAIIRGMASDNSGFAELARALEASAQYTVIAPMSKRPGRGGRNLVTFDIKLKPRSK